LQVPGDLGLTTRSRRSALIAVVVAGALALPAAAQAEEYVVENTADSGPGSLRQALADAAATADGEIDTIAFTRTVRGTIQLASELEITSPVDIKGPTGDVITIDGGGATRDFHVHDLPPGPADVRIYGLTLTGGKADRGGGVLSEAGEGISHHLILDAMKIEGNAATNGAGVFSDDASLTTHESSISRNNAGDGNSAGAGGGLYIADTPAARPLGVQLLDSRFVGNTALGDGGNILTAGVDSDVLISNSAVVAGRAGGEGAGLVLSQDAGGAELRSSTVSQNRAALGAGGVAIDAVPGRTLISNSTIALNIAQYGGGIASIQNADGPVVVQNSTIAGNTARDDPGGGGIFRQGLDGPGGGADEFKISSTVVAGNATTRGIGPDLRQALAAAGKFSVDHSLIGNTVGADIDGGGTNLLNRDAQLGGLGEHGGLGNTMLPASSSPLVDAGIANGLARDQRGEKRRFNDPGTPQARGSDGTDIGAVELQKAGGGLEGVVGAAVKAKKKQKVKGGKARVKVTARAGEHVAVTAGGTVTLRGKRKGSKKTTVALKSAKGEAKGGGAAKLVLTPPKVANRKIVKTLRRKGRAAATVEVRLTDDTGNLHVERERVVLKRKQPKR
jgi:hypothetical protein